MGSTRGRINQLHVAIQSRYSLQLTAVRNSKWPFFEQGRVAISLQSVAYN